MEPSGSGLAVQEGPSRLPSPIPFGMSLSTQLPLGNTRKFHTEGLWQNFHMYTFGFMDIGFSIFMRSFCFEVK